MSLKIYTISGDKAAILQRFTHPEVWEHPNRDEYWFLAAVDEKVAGGILGAAVIDPAMPEAMLLSISVLPEYRRKGVATAMLDRAIDLLAQAGITGLRAICALEQREWMAVRNLLTLNGFELEVESAKTHSVPLHDLLNHPILSARPENKQAVSLASLSSAERGSLAALLRKLQVSPQVIQEADHACSYVHRRDGQIDAMFLLGKMPNGSLNNLWTWVSTQSGSSRGLIDLFACAFHEAAKTMPDETPVMFTCLGEAGEKLLHHFMPDNTPVYTACSYFTLTAYDDEKEPKRDTAAEPLSDEQPAAADDRA